MTLGPTEPLSTGSSIDLPLLLSVNVIVPVGAPTFVLFPSMDAPRSLRPQAVADLSGRICRYLAIIKWTGIIAMQYRICEIISIRQHLRCARAFPLCPVPP